MTVRCLTPAQADQLLNDATIGELLHALDPHRTIDGGACPRCDADAWAVDQLVWTCTAGCRGTIHTLRHAVADRLDALTRLAHADRITGPPLTQDDHDRLPNVIDPDGWATPADLFTAMLHHRLDYDDQIAWCRLFARAHGADLLADLLEPVEPPQLTTALIDVRSQLRAHNQRASAA